jgi:L-asparaginase
LKAGINIEVKTDNVGINSEHKLRISDISPQPIGVITLYPGISSDVIRNTLQQPVKALILLSFGVGNAPQSPSFLAELKQACEQDIVILNCTQCMRGKVNMTGYANGHALRESGVISGGDMTPEAALAKLHYLLSKKLPTPHLKRQLVANLCGELSP